MTLYAFRFMRHGVDTTDSATWQPAGWEGYQALGKARAQAEHKPAQVSVTGYSGVDCRVVPTTATAELARLDATIAAAHRARQVYLEEHFREWPLVTPETATNVSKYRFPTKAEALAHFRDSA